MCVFLGGAPEAHHPVARVVDLAGETPPAARQELRAALRGEELEVRHGRVARVAPECVLPQEERSRRREGGSRERDGGRARKRQGRQRKGSGLRKKEPLQ